MSFMPIIETIDSNKYETMKDNLNFYGNTTSKNGRQWKVYEKDHDPLWKIKMGLLALFATLGTFFVGLYFSKNIRNLWHKA